MVEKVRLLNTRAVAPVPDTASWVTVLTKPCSVTLSKVTGLSPVMATGALVSVRPVTRAPPARVSSRLPPLIAGAVEAGVEMNSPFTRIGVESVTPPCCPEMSRILKCEPVPGVSIDRSMTPVAAVTTLWVPEGA